jgi:hypothetical protein
MVKEFSIFWFVLVTFIMTYIFFSHNLTWGSLWCWIVNLLAFACIIKVFWKDICL